ncbi:MAG: hypothetical protein M1816_006748 [Peltula sp. TS41687]|nr:MAG: hypothetical protein M1816_006748 [Peltula sp. TS41687]
MGRQAYLTRLALGRSPYEDPEITPSSQPDLTGSAQAESRPDAAHSGQCSSSDQYIQQYDVRGHPINRAARDSARSVIRAHNDVLATVGVCVGVPATSRLHQPRLPVDRRKAAETIKATFYESQNGVKLLILDYVTLFAATWWIAGLRYRLQVYPMLSELSFGQSVRLQVKQFGLLAFVFAGLPAYLVRTAVYFTRGVLLNRLRNWISERQKADHDGDPSFSRWEIQLFYHIYYPIAICLPWICVTPFVIYGRLQQLFLIPAYPLVPGPSFMRQLLSMSLPRNLSLSGRRFVTLDTLKQCSLALLGSPLILALIHSQANWLVKARLPKFIRCRLPRPPHPDVYSVAAAKMGFNGELLEILDNKKNIPLWTRIRTFLRDLQENIRQGFWEEHAVDQSMSGQENQPTTESSRQNNSSEPEQVLQPQAPQPQVEPTPRQPETTTARGSRNDPNNGGRRTIRPPTRPLSEDDTIVSAQTSPVEAPPEGLWVEHVRGQTPSANNIQVHHRGTHFPQPSRRPDPRASEARALFKKLMTEHRITSLTLFPRNAFAGHLSHLLATLITLPLETFMIRKLAGSYLATGRSPGIGAPLLGLRLSALQPGLGTSALLRSCFNYPRRFFVRILQCTAIQLMISGGLIVVGVQGTMWYGKRYFGWMRGRKR